ncbi:NAD(P)/FAD-dependent oxidoreductase [Micromonospora sp. DT48]|uniref:NAD(P)/FAD-dependent oxidoreductase n=1 Tax=unclassified Micromonospora TaxID=2617518 RepID=UPI0012BC5D8A|nr:FAD-binding oxidoreductase [Micromonospora sp. CP22]MTK03959.1 FAD-binding oxidoreductase [Micromonospora sp. CP22]
MIDCLVVGGGIIGASVAHQAASRHPGWAVHLLDPRGIGCGTTAASAGLYVPFGATTGIRSLVRDGEPVFSAYRSFVAEDTIRELRFLVVLRTTARSAFLATMAGGAAHEPTSDDLAWLADRYPECDLAGHEIVRLDGAYRVRAGELAGQLVAASPNVRVVAASVNAVRRHERRWLVEHDHGTTTAARVVLAVGPWDLPALDAPAPPVAHPPEDRKRVVALHAYNAPTATDRAVYFLDDDVFLLPEPRLGYTVTSFYLDRWDQPPGIGEPVPTPSDQAAGRAVVARRVGPSFAATCAGGRAGTDVYQAQRLPAVLWLDADGSLLFAGAGSGSGVRLAPGMAARAVDRLTAV